MLRATIDVSLIAYAIVLGHALLRRSSTPPVWVRTLSSIGCLLCMIHIALAMHFVHHWSHTRAVEHTAQITEELIGWRFGGGVYFNYLFVLVWFADVVWSWADPTGYGRRSRLVGVAVQLYLIFIAVNGAVVFVNGPVRWYGLGVCIVLAGLLLWKSLQAYPPRE